MGLMTFGQFTDVRTVNKPEQTGEHKAKVNEAIEPVTKTGIEGQLYQIDDKGYPMPDNELLDWIQNIEQNDKNTFDYIFNIFAKSRGGSLIKILKQEGIDVLPEDEGTVLQAIGNYMGI